MSAKETSVAESTSRGVQTMVKAINETLFDAMSENEKVMVFGQDVAQSGGVFRATDGLKDRYGSERVVDMPLAEGVIVGSAVGLAMGGMVPVAEIQFLGFMYQAWHQLAGQAGRMRARTRSRFPLQLTVRTPFGGCVRTPELHSDSLIPQLASIPGLKIVAPASASDARGLLRTAIDDPDPVVVLEPLRGYRGIKDEVPSGDHRVPLGKARWARHGSDVTIITWSYQVSVAQRAAAILESQGISAAILDLRSIVPLDINAIVQATEHTGRVVILEEAAPTAGFAAEVMAVINEHAFYSLEAPPLRISGYSAPYPVNLLEDTYVPDVARVISGVEQIAEVKA